MSILKESGGMQRVCCDDCGAEHDSEFHERQFMTMIEAVKEDGWKVRLEDGEWHHYCDEPTCDTASAAPKAARQLRTPRLSKVDAAKKLFGFK